MFTGLVEEMGSVLAVSGSRDAKTLTVKGLVVLENSQIGDSIAINGVCQTITSIDRDRFTVQVLKESLGKTTLGRLSVGKKVNLERALTLNRPLGGHIVQGHIQETGTVLGIKRVGENSFLSLRLSRNLMAYMVREGSIAVDGLSLTISKVRGDTVEINIIPHTLKETTVGLYKVGDLVNIEPDVLIKATLDKKSDGLTKEKLLSWGY